MSHVVIQNLTSNPLFGLVLSLGVYLFFNLLYQRFSHPLLNPLLLSIITIVTFLSLTGIPYDSFNVGGNLLTILITPATVALAIPLREHFSALLKNYKAIGLGIGLGALVHGLIVSALASLFGYSPELLASILPKSVTTAIAVEVSESVGGMGSLTVAIVVMTGLLGPIAGPILFKWLRITDPIAQGISLGSTTHAVGTSKAIELGDVQGAMSGLAVVVTGILTVALSPAFFTIVQKLIG